MKLDRVVIEEYQRRGRGTSCQCFQRRLIPRESAVRVRVAEAPRVSLNGNASSNSETGAAPFARWRPGAMNEGPTTGPRRWR